MVKTLFSGQGSTRCFSSATSRWISQVENLAILGTSWEAKDAKNRSEECFSYHGLSTSYVETISLRVFPPAIWQLETSRSKAAGGDHYQWPEVQISSNFLAFLAGAWGSRIKRNCGAMLGPWFSSVFPAKHYTVFFGGCVDWPTWSLECMFPNFCHKGCWMLL